MKIISCYNQLMIFIGENIHVISKSVREALINHDENFLKNLIKLQTKMDYTDLNAGPASGELKGILSWLCPVVEQNSGLKISLDTTNFEEMKSAFNFIKNKEDVFLNSASNDLKKLDLMIELALKYNCNLVLLTMSKEAGIPKTADERLEIAFQIYERCIEKGLSSENLFFDPLVLPVSAAQAQGVECLNTLKMIKESFDPPVKTIIGLSNISNGVSPEIRPLINRVFGVLAYGAGLDAVIMDAKDDELYRILKMLDVKNPADEIDKLYLNISDMIANFGEIEDLMYDRTDEFQVKIIKTCEVLLNRKIYSNSFAQV